ncbi:hypothetical protein ACWFMI_14810 [Nocardiopsis terrae]
MAKASYSRNHKGTGQLMRTPEMLRVLKKAAQRGESAARAAASPDSTFRVESSRRGSGAWKDRAEARLINTSPDAAEAEYDGPGPGPLNTAIDAIERGGG